MWLHRLNRVVAWRAMEVAGPLATRENEQGRSCSCRAHGRAAERSGHRDRRRGGRAPGS